MQRILITLSGFGEMLREKYADRFLYDFSKKENLDALAANGSWGHVHLGHSPEKAYFSFFEERERLFPGESYLRCIENDIPVEEDQTVFLGRFLTHCEGRVVDTCVPLSEKETSLLLAAVRERKTFFTYRVTDREAVLIFDRHFPETALITPFSLRRRRFRDFCPRDKDLLPLTDLMHSSVEILEEHPVNNIRKDLGENVANLLWLWAMGRKREYPGPDAPFTGTRCFCSLSGKMSGLAEYLGFERYKTFSPGRENTAWWLHASLTENGGPSAWVKDFETLDRELLGMIRRELAPDKYKLLIVFDAFINECAEVVNPWAVFLQASGPENATRLPGGFKNVRNSHKLWREFLR